MTEHSVARAAVMQRDWHRIRHRKGEWRALAERSAAEVERRRALVPVISYPEELPLTASVPEIRELLQQHQVVIVAGETGSGKTTQLPKVCLEAGFGVRGMIAHTQPRRIAARAVASRIADELDVPLGEQVGYSVRFADQAGDNTLIKLVTDGLLLTEIRSDRFLDRYDAIIIDEAHERSLNIDFLLGILKRLLARRPELRVIVTSATIDVDSFARYFDAPVVSVAGRSYPVDVQYTPSEKPLEQAVEDALLAIEALPVSGAARDVLAFHAGEGEIMAVARHLRRQLGERWEILPLYARLSAAEQARVFQTGARRRIVLTTNVAETSLTVPNVGFVIDPGFARISRYSYRSKLQRLPVEPISQASAQQRTGRAGRVAPGVCFRLYDGADFAGRPEFSEPEIRRTNLASVILQMHDLGLGKPSEFPFIDPPEPRAFTDGARLLEELGALEAGRLTPQGQHMSRLPVDPRLARMLLAGAQHGSLREVLIIVTALAVQDPRERPAEKRAAADEQHRPFTDKRSDFLFFVNLWTWLHERKAALTNRRFQREVGAHFLAWNRVREWFALHRQLKRSCEALKLRPNEQPADYAAIHRALLTGSLSLIGLHDERGRYLGARNSSFRVFPGSSLFGQTPKWLMASEIVETSQVFARTVATIEPGWVEQAAGGLLKRSYSEPHWSAKRGETFAFEAVALYGLRLAERRRVAYSRIDPAVARDLFLRDGLVAGAVSERFEFLQANQALIREIRELEAKGRRRDLLVTDDVQVAFYAERVPADVCNVTQLKRWLKRRGDEAALCMTRADVLATDGFAPTLDDYPATLQLRDASFTVKYRFAPGEIDDGVTLRVPVGMLPAVVQEPLDWLVPGLFPALCEALVRSLPKNLRRVLAPVPDAVQQLLPPLLSPKLFRSGRLLPALAEQIRAEFRIDVPLDAWDWARIDPSLRVNVQVLDERGRVLAQGRDVEALKQSLKSEFSARVRKDADALTATDLQAFPETLPATHVAKGVVAYPALKVEGDRVNLVLLDNELEQHSVHRAGLARLAVQACGKEAKQLARRVQHETQLGLHYAPLGTQSQLIDQVQAAACWQVFFEGEPWPENRTSFDERIRERKGRLASAADALLPWAAAALARRFEAARALDELASKAFDCARQDLDAHLKRLVPATFLTATPWPELAQLPRYLDAVLVRIRNLPGRVDKDLRVLGPVVELERRFVPVQAALGHWHPEVVRLRFLLEELRIATFAQTLKTREKVSVKRIAGQLTLQEQALGLA